MPDGRTWTHTGSLGTDPGAHAVEFSKTAAPSREGVSFADGAPERDPLRAGLVSIAPIRGPEGLARGGARAAPGGAGPRRPPWSAIASGPFAQAPEVALADLQHRAVQAVRIEV